jgi:plasmid stability protein
MPAIQVRGLDELIVTALKARASRHGRSLPGEVKRILDEATRPDELPVPRGRHTLKDPEVRRARHVRQEEIAR